MEHPYSALDPGFRYFTQPIFVIFITLVRRGSRICGGGGRTASTAHLNYLKIETERENSSLIRGKKGGACPPWFRACWWSHQPLARLRPYPNQLLYARLDFSHLVIYVDLTPRYNNQLPQNTCIHLHIRVWMCKTMFVCVWTLIL